MAFGRRGLRSAHAKTRTHPMEHRRRSACQCCACPSARRIIYPGWLSWLGRHTPGLAPLCEGCLLLECADAGFQSAANLSVGWRPDFALPALVYRGQGEKSDDQRSGGLCGSGAPGNGSGFDPAKDSMADGRVHIAELLARPPTSQATGQTRKDAQALRLRLSHLSRAAYHGPILDLP